MNQKLNDFKENILDKKIAVLGLGISNRPLIKYLSKIGVKEISGFDRAEKDSVTAREIEEELKGCLTNIYLGKNYFDELNKHKYDYIFKTPVIRYDVPQLMKAKEAGAVITSEMQVFMELCPAQMFAVTGSDGKTTTTTLIYEMLKEEGYKTWLGGNIGRPLLDCIDEVNERDMVVLELSSFQLHTMSISPKVAVVTNISPNHLDVHKSYVEYMEAKSNIFAHQKAAAGDFTVLNAGNAAALDYAKQVPAASRFFNRKECLDAGVYIKDEKIFFRKTADSEDVEIVNIEEILLPGEHNLENYMAAIAAVIDWVKPVNIRRVAKNFGGVEHRLELVRILDNVKYYNSSIDSSPSRTIAALGTFKDKVILIAGGKDKGISYDELGPYIFEKVKILILIGPTGELIVNAVMKEAERRGISDLSKYLEIIYCTTYEEVVSIARNQAVSGDCVLLSPASTSFDMFKNFEERGQTFKRLVKEL